MLRHALTVAAAVVGLFAAAPALAGGEGSTLGTAAVYVIHGIPGQDLGLAEGLPVDVLLDDADCLLHGFKFGQIEGPFHLAAGAHNLKIGLAVPDERCTFDTVLDAVVDQDFTVVAGEVATVIAHLDENGEPAASLFANDVSRTPAFTARLIIHHAAATDSVDLFLRRGRFGSILALRDVLNGDQLTSMLRSGAWGLRVRSTAERRTIYGPERLILKSGHAFFAYVVGSVDNDTITLIVHVIDTRY